MGLYKQLLFCIIYISYLYAVNGDSKSRPLRVGKDEGTASEDTKPAHKVTTVHNHQEKRRTEEAIKTKRVTTRATQANADQIKTEERPCPEWYGGEVRPEVNMLLLTDERGYGAPHFTMTPTAFSSPSYFQRPCTIGSKAPTTEKCAAELQAITSLKDRITMTIKKAEKS